MQILWLIIIGFVAGIIAKFLDPGSSNEPSGFILTTLLGIAGSFVATYLGQALGWYQAGEGAGLSSCRGRHRCLVIWGPLPRGSRQQQYDLARIPMASTFFTTRTFRRTRLKARRTGALFAGTRCG
jgi:uncharacterized membrane protein YeaQ/YmgE (transglycosylase-associated protein family)